MNRDSGGIEPRHVRQKRLKFAARGGDGQNCEGLPSTNNFMQVVQADISTVITVTSD